MVEKEPVELAEGDDLLGEEGEGLGRGCVGRGGEERDAEGDEGGEGWEGGGEEGLQEQKGELYERWSDSVGVSP